MNIDNTSIDNTTSIDNIPPYKCRLYEPRVSITPQVPITPRLSITSNYTNVDYTTHEYR